MQPIPSKQEVSPFPPFPTKGSQKAERARLYTLATGIFYRTVNNRVEIQLVFARKDLKEVNLYHLSKITFNT